MRKLILPILASLALYCGCATSPDGNSVPDTERIANISKEAATMAAEELLRIHPEWMPQLQLALTELRHLQHADSISVRSLFEIIDRLPVKALGSDEARISIRGARLTISAVDLPELSADRLAALRPIVGAIADGLVAGGVVPPDPQQEAALIEALRAAMK
jgi:hypothetical protein